jgi:hypothetical protein
VVSTPSITGLTPNTGTVGSAVTIAGNNFGSSQGSSTVTFNGTSAGSAISWSANSITVNVPAGATTVNVLVTVELATDGALSPCPARVRSICRSLELLRPRCPSIWRPTPQHAISRRVNLPVTYP